MKLIRDVPENIKVYPFDLGVKSGQHPFNILFSDSLLYVLDAGKQIGYIDDVDENLGDGKISVISRDGSTVETMMTNNQGTAFNDPHFGYINESQQMLYYSDRNTGIRRLALTERNLQMDITNDKYAYFVQNTSLGYYDKGFGWGAMNTSFTRLNDGTWWWPKTYNNLGIFRFKDSDIGGSDIPASGITAGGLFIKSLAIDEQRQMVFLLFVKGQPVAFMLYRWRIFLMNRRGKLHYKIKSRTISYRSLSLIAKVAPVSMSTFVRWFWIRKTALFILDSVQILLPL